MKYVLIDISRGDQFEKEFEDKDKDKALRQGELDFGKKTPADHCTEFYLLESVNPDEETENHLDGNIVKRWK